MFSCQAAGDCQLSFSSHKLNRLFSVPASSCPCGYEVLLEVYPTIIGQRQGDIWSRCHFIAMQHRKAKQCTTIHIHSDSLLICTLRLFFDCVRKTYTQSLQGHANKVHIEKPPTTTPRHVHTFRTREQELDLVLFFVL